MTVVNAPVYGPESTHPLGVFLPHIRITREMREICTSVEKYQEKAEFFMYSCIRKGNHNAKRTPRDGLQLPSAALSRVPSFLGAISVVVYFLAALVSLVISFSIVPREVMPWTVYGENVGHHSTTSLSNSESLDYNSGKGHVRQLFSYDVDACYYGLAMTSLALDVPLLPCLLGITEILLRENPTKKREIKDNSKKSGEIYRREDFIIVT
ncbi:hypothetical protein ACS0TY_033875 [Phlomoides rotata]